MVTRRPHPTHWADRFRRWWPRRVTVSGNSMRPAFLPGDRLVVLAARTVHPGQVVAVRDPRRPDRVLVKRVWAVGPAGLDVRGDHAAASTDSRHFGPVALGLVVGRVVYRYHPADRSGRIGD